MLEKVLLFSINNLGKHLLPMAINAIPILEYDVFSLFHPMNKIIEPIRCSASPVIKSVIVIFEGPEKITAVVQNISTLKICLNVVA